ncbi:MAG: UPF0149 family protein [Steroidobacteraceae bacterium]
MLQVTFPEITRVLRDLQSSVAAAESHGCLCGALCTTAHYSVERWLDELVAQSDDADDSRQPLSLLFTDTVRALRGDEMEFELLLPDDDSALEDRAVALSQWCQGFLYGFGAGDPVDPQQLPPDVDEVLRDLTHIGRATVESRDGSEEEEQAYAQIVEYVRVGVQLIHDELMDVREREAGDAPGEHDPSGSDPSRLH